MDITITPSQLNGTVCAPPSKSDVHRAVICAALSGGVCDVAPVAMSDDIKATVGCIEALGAKTSLNGDVLKVNGTDIFKKKTAVLDCCESGSTLRFFIPIAAAGGVNATFTGKGRLPERPLNVYLDCLPRAGVKCVYENNLPLTIEGRLKSGIFDIAGNISSQFITGLLFALPLLRGDSKIILTTKLQSEGYVDMTLGCMRRFGVSVDRADYGYFVKGNQHYAARSYRTDGDWSQAAFFMTAGALSGSVTVSGLNVLSSQGDKKIADLLMGFGANVKYDGDSVIVKKSELRARDINASQIPDLVPILAVAASVAEGTTRIYKAERLRAKESDRLKSTADMINSLGGWAQETSDGLLITGVKQLKGGTVKGYNDHRIVMAASVAALRCENEVTITDSESINKSFPNYFEEYTKLGGKTDVNLRR
ncbi:MAG: 3-phosphoshikimate 1-carboxyvinyltransferase [Ruminococcus sp.]|nr:3-phosphoshikimate 1-carboxyvinyltransferase [Ruminococcus sp.]